MVTNIFSAKRKHSPHNILFSIALLLCVLSQNSEAGQQDGPEPLSYDELARLSEQYGSDPTLREKVVRQLSDPFVDNGASAP